MKPALYKMLAFSGAGNSFADCAAARASLPSHPRLFPQKISETPEAGKLAERICYDADFILGYPPQEKEMVGRRMLPVSNNVLYRINTLTVTRRITGKKAYAERAIQEMLCAASYDNWNPDHFLDTAEMTLALAIGYDSLYDFMTEKDRAAIETAIVEKGIKPSLETRHWWQETTNNWNAVCNCGMLGGALAVGDKYPDIREKVLTRALKGISLYLTCYAPLGAYPEGPAYWGYGTDFVTLLLAMLENVYGSDFGLSNSPGFNRTGGFVSAMTGPSGMVFNYADCAKGAGYNTFAQIRLAEKYNRGWFGETERKRLLDYAESRPDSVMKGASRLMPLALFYLPVSDDTAKMPLSYFSGKESEVHVSTHRSGCSRNAAWVGIKGGSPYASHGHMDGGSFVFDLDQYRWVTDLGADDYTKIEATGLNLWDGGQNGDRWKIFRLGPESHNILRIDGGGQNVAGKGVIVDFSGNGTEMDLTSLYTPAAEKIMRYFHLSEDRSLTVEDQLSGLKPGSVVMCQICTEADAKTLPDGTLKLYHGKKTLLLRKNIPGDWEIVPADSLCASYDTPNPGVKMIRFAVAAPPQGELRIKVVFQPE